MTTFRTRDPLHPPDLTKTSFRVLKIEELLSENLVSAHAPRARTLRYGVAIAAWR
ncbi:hypothetical protein GCM10009677_52940 [Sphaerisporangium rubeum]|uniref:Uncharacterized protein n=1 Tax=Sphaerisporangium rubeum TaxID=321317 RepID=A0A7X0II19_9ACTN|nr:hypothetical protein [Sphaerisporangium rubeum]MBB6475601.1 hypothetical protein [Sphaerisporangium rubeum]